MKKFRKVVVVVMVAMMAMAALAGCGGKDSTPEIVGTWSVSELEASGVSISVEEYAKQLGQGEDAIKMDLTCKEDKSFSMDMAGVKTEGTWKEKDGKFVLTVDGEDQEVSITDGKLVLEEATSGMKMTMKKK
ncbi:MAG: lipocalin family protein [Lachnospiraceae bacterium]|nr:lipocalin family protein [Lachnospiraceae bacterium]